MADKSDSPLQSFFRLTIMVGTAVVGGMAFKVYGPPPEQLGPMFNQALTYAQQVVADMSGDASAPASSPARRTAPSMPAAPAFAASSVSAAFAPAPAVTAATNRSASIAAAVAGDPSLEPLVAQLEAAGAEQLQLNAWGVEARLVRCTCTTAVAGSAFKRMIDTIEPTSRDALRGVLAQLQPAAPLAQLSSTQAY